MNMGHDLLLILPQMMVLLTGIVMLVLEMLGKQKTGLWIVAAGLLAAAGLSLSRLGMDTTAFSQTFRIDRLSLWATILLCPGTVLLALLARHELKGTPREGTVYSLMIFSTLGALLLAGSGDLMLVVLGLLLNSLSGFALAAYPKTNKSSEGAMKYFVFGSVTGAIMIFGLTYWVGATGSTLLSGLHGVPLPATAAIAGFIGLIIGTGYAASIVPFHFWTPDAFEGAPVSVAAFLSVVPKIGAIFALAQVLKELPVHVINWPLVMAVLAALSMTFGNVVALWQQNLIRLLAYSTVAQAGYFLLGIVAIGQSEMAVDALVVFGVAYTLMNTGAFALVMGHGTALEDFNGVGKKFPWHGVAMAIFLFSLTGIPPLAGFAGKFLLFSAALDSQFTWLAVVAILNSVISLAVYLRILIPMYNQQVSSTDTMNKPSRLVSFVWIICLCFTLLVGLGIQVFL